MLKILDVLCQRGSIRQIDYQFANFIASREKVNLPQSEQEKHQAIGFIAGILSIELSKGHICINPDDFDYIDALNLYGEAALSLTEILRETDWSALLNSAASVGHAGESKPLIYEDGRLYLQRYWFYEQSLAEKLLAISVPFALTNDDISNLSESLDHLFARQYHYLFSALSQATTSMERQQLVCDHLDVVTPDEIDWSAVEQVLTDSQKVSDLSELDVLIPQSACINWQKVAAAVALSRRFAVISGGPGTGKTTTVAKLLAAIVEHEKRYGRTLNIKMVAPTGKAAARLTESLGTALRQLPVSNETKSLIPAEAGTIHRLLGAIPNRAEFRHNRSNRLHLDMLVVDEASMVDLSMMYKLLDALPDHARVILLGDKDQLSSVEAGAVLGDICSLNQKGYSRTHVQLLTRLTKHAGFKDSADSEAVADSLCMLQKSYRFDARSGIGQLAKAVNNGEITKLKKLWNKFKDISVYSLDDANYEQMLTESCENYKAYLNISDRSADTNSDSIDELAREALAAFGRFRLLCAVREGDFGVEGLNRRIEKKLTSLRRITAAKEAWYPGRPVMITQNDYSLGLYNGDIGICLLIHENDELKMKVFFELPDGEIKAILPGRLPSHETAYAMTIHKSQGSEFDNPVMVLPPVHTQILTRELIYTGITRARKHFTIFADSEVLRKSIMARTQRVSGLVDRLSDKTKA